MTTETSKQVSERREATRDEVLMVLEDGPEHARECCGCSACELIARVKADAARRFRKGDLFLELLGMMALLAEASRETK